MIDSLVFSKDRACQLDLLLRSIKDNFKEIHPTILFKASDDNFKNGYNKIKEYHPEFEWIEENDFVIDLKKLIVNFNKDFFLILVDDEVVIRDYQVQEALDVMMKSDKVHAVSLRMNPSVQFTYTANVPSSSPTFYIDKKFPNILLWKWGEYPNPGADWGYPSCINSHIYRRKFITHYILNLSYRNVNALEGCLNLQRKDFKQYMACFQKSKTINIANNIIQTGRNRHSNKPEYTVFELNKKFLECNRISIENFYEYENNLATLERDYIWLK